MGSIPAVHEHADKSVMPDGVAYSEAGRKVCCEMVRIVQGNQKALTEVNAIR